MEEIQFNSYVALEVDWGRETLAVGWSIIIRRQFSLKFSVSAIIKTLSGEDLVILYEDVLIMLFFEWAEGGVGPAEMIKDFLS